MSVKFFSFLSFSITEGGGWSESEVYGATACVEANNLATWHE